MRWERERTNNCAPPPFYIFVLKVFSFFLVKIGDVKMPLRSIHSIIIFWDEEANK